MCVQPKTPDDDASKVPLDAPQTRHRAKSKKQKHSDSVKARHSAAGKTVRVREPQKKATAAEKGKAIAHSEEAIPTRRGKRHETNTLLHFPSYKQAEIFQSRFQGRAMSKIKVPKVEDFTGFDFMDILQRLGWVPFMLIEDVVYPDLVRKFYCNVDKKLMTYVKGIHIPMTPEMIREVFNLEEINDEQTCEVLDEMDFSGITRGETGKDKKAVVHTKELPNLNAKLLHYMVAHVLFPRSGSYSQILQTDARIMYALMNGHPLDLANEVIAHMVSCRNKRKGTFPYAMHITQILRHFGVDLRHEHSEVVKGAYHVDISACGRLGYKHVQGRGWILKAEAGNDMNEDVVDVTGEQNVHDGAEKVGMEETHGDVGGGRVQHAKLDESRQQHIMEASQGSASHSVSLDAKLDELKQHLIAHFNQALSSLHPLPSLAAAVPANTPPFMVDQSTPATSTLPLHSMFPPTGQLTTSIASPTDLLTPSTSPSRGIGLQLSPQTTRTLQLSSTIAAATELLTPSPTPNQGGQSFTAYSNIHRANNDRTSAYDPSIFTFPPLPSPADNDPKLTSDHVLYMTRHNMFLTGSINRLITAVEDLTQRMDGVQSRLNEWEQMISTKTASMARVISRASQDMQESHERLATALQGLVIHLYYPPPPPTPVSRAQDEPMIPQPAPVSQQAPPNAPMQPPQDPTQAPFQHQEVPPSSASQPAQAPPPQQGQPYPPQTRMHGPQANDTFSKFYHTWQTRAHEFHEAARSKDGDNTNEASSTNNN